MTLSVEVSRRKSTTEFLLANTLKCPSDNGTTRMQHVMYRNFFCTTLYLDGAPSIAGDSYCNAITVVTILYACPTGGTFRIDLESIIIIRSVSHIHAALVSIMGVGEEDTQKLLVYPVCCRGSSIRSVRYSNYLEDYWPYVARLSAVDAIGTQNA